MTQVRTNPIYPRKSNGKIERYHRTIKPECIRTKTPSSLHEAHTSCVVTYDSFQRHSGIGSIIPAAMLNGQAEVIHAAQHEKLVEERERRKNSSRASLAGKKVMYDNDTRPEDWALPSGSPIA